MKFYSLAVLGVLCSLSSMSHARRSPTEVRCVRETLEENKSTSEPREKHTTTPEPAHKWKFSPWGGRFRAEPWSKAGQIGPGVRPWRTATNENDLFRVKP